MWRRKTFARVRVPGRQPRARTRGNHRRSKTSSTRRSTSPLKPDADPVFAGNIDLDPLRNGGCRSGHSGLLRCNHNRDELRRPPTPRKIVAVPLAPIEDLVRIHIVLPDNNGDRRARRKRGGNKLLFQRFRPGRLRRHCSPAFVSIIVFVDTFTLTRQDNIALSEMRRFGKTALGGGLR
jgi:hypothetical protein